MSKDTVFTNDTGAAGGTTQYVQDVFPDVTFAPTNNTGLTNNSNTNPLGVNFANDDLPKFTAKRLFIKDLLLISDRSKWISNKPTYQVVFQDYFPNVVCYVFGNINFASKNGQYIVQFKTIGDGISVNGVVRRVMFIVDDDTAATATAQVVVDGSNGNTIDFSGLATNSSTQNISRFSAFVHSSSNETKDLHDIRLTALQSNTLKVSGVVVYFENSGANIDQFPGTTYVNKTKVTTTTGATMALPSFGSSLGGKAVIYKTSFSGYTVSAMSATTIASLGTGSSGTNLLTVTTGHGASFKAGYGVIMTQGTSTYVGNVVSVSTDTLTVAPTMGFGTSTTASLYTAWKAGSTLAINASLMSLAYSIDFSQYQGISPSILEPTGAYAFWGNNIGITTMDSVNSAYFLGASGFMQVDGYFSAAEVETIGNAIFSATLSINGLAAWSQNAGQTGTIRKTVFTDAGPGWNSFNLGVGASMGNIGIYKINLYQYASTVGQTYGVLAEYDQTQTYTDRGACNATIMALGGNRRVYADQMYLKGAWIRTQTATAPGAVEYRGCTTNAVFRMEYYGKNYGIIGTVNGGTLTLDGAGVALNFNVMNSVASEGFHTVTYTAGAGTTTIIQAFDYNRSVERFKIGASVFSTTPAIPVVPKALTRSEVRYRGVNGWGSVATCVARLAVTEDVFVGTDISVTDDASNGTVITTNTDGIYTISASAEIAALANISMVITKDATVTDTTTSADTFTAISRVAWAVVTGSNAKGTAVFVTWTGFCKAGTKLRVQGDGSQTFADAGFSVTKVG